MRVGGVPDLDLLCFMLCESVSCFLRKEGREEPNVHGMVAKVVRLRSGGRGSAGRFSARRPRTSQDDTKGGLCIFCIPATLLCDSLEEEWLVHDLILVPMDSIRRLQLWFVVRY